MGSKYIWTTPTNKREVVVPEEMVNALALVDKNFPGSKCVAFRSKETEMKRRKP